MLTAPLGGVGRSARVRGEIGVLTAARPDLGPSANADRAVREATVDPVHLGRPAPTDPPWPGWPAWPAWPASELDHEVPSTLLSDDEG